MKDDYIKVECSVHLVPTEKVSTIRMFEDEDGVSLQHLGTKHEGGQSVKVEFRYVDKVLATSEKDDGYPTIGLDFMWTYTDKFKKIKSVYLYLQKENWKDKVVKLRSNGDVHVSPCDEKEFTEKDVIMMLSYALAHEKVTAREMKDKIDEVLNWFKS
jgi:hypothetical protein